ncbi:NAD(P)-dependent oxidoreductase [Actinocrispum wychmicini]|uniref:3-hydroxyisobutyrate dehydrogenase n=1 Tax=Actinocrispum wychmicini TaxID=1213861 RepID=A0A4R2JIF4_9PSEU|nr:NAD(P)-dependent oxidoreductase [Actinocrispum wychmicini]TCO58527.1 3-hydroxyisobutyrate dehydrogenase [Actinocrispum wychmicini]
MRVALLGTGIMGTGMAKNIARAGIPIKAWNRSKARAEPLAEHGVTVTDTAAEAVDGADVVITMLHDADSVESVIKNVTLGPETVWAQMSTVGIAGTARLAALSDRFVDAPVLGTKKPAEDGTLVVMASGPAELKDKVTPVFEAVSSRLMWIADEPGAASKLKLVINGWMQCVLAGVAQTVAFAEAVGVDPRLFLDTIRGQASDSLIAQGKGAAMIARDFAPTFALDGLEKDTDLIAQAIKDSGVDASVITAILNVTRRARDLGHGDEDMAAIYYAFRPDR